MRIEPRPLPATLPFLGDLPPLLTRLYAARGVQSEVELDKSVLEKLADPLNHLVRNACDHGLEVSGIRLANGKTEVGTLELIARQEGGQILVRIEDDGRGIDPEKVKAKALERGLVTLAELEGMSDYQSQSLILKAGFSTAEKVTDISGRGVGLDVVKTNLESIGKPKLITFRQPIL